MGMADMLTARGLWPKVVGAAVEEGVEDRANMGAVGVGPNRAHRQTDAAYSQDLEKRNK
jgi:hypothetical protein